MLTFVNKSKNEMYSKTIKINKYINKLLRVNCIGRLHLKLSLCPKVSPASSYKQTANCIRDINWPQENTMDNNLLQCTAYSPVCNKTPKIVHYVLNRVLLKICLHGHC